jgi:hypothetical protein
MRDIRARSVQHKSLFEIDYGFGKRDDAIGMPTSEFGIEGRLPVLVDPDNSNVPHIDNVSKSLHLQSEQIFELVYCGVVQKLAFWCRPRIHRIEPTVPQYSCSEEGR